MFTSSFFTEETRLKSIFCTFFSISCLFPLRQKYPDRFETMFRAVIGKEDTLSLNEPSGRLLLFIYILRVVGIEPTVSAWKANRLPLTDTRCILVRKDGIRTHGSRKNSSIAN